MRDTEITMHAGAVELGSWPATAVGIRRFDPTAFEFTAEGDRLIFTPDDPAGFGDSPIFDGHDTSSDSRKDRTAKKNKGPKSKKKSNNAEPGFAWEQNSPDEERNPRRQAAEESPKGRPRKQPRRHRNAPAEATGAKAESREVAPLAPPTLPGPISPASDDEEAVSDAPSSDLRRQTKSRDERPVPGPEPDDHPYRKPEEKGKGAWIRALDLARKYDTFGLDRVPVDESLRGREHQHTWDHRVAASSGLGKHICTICGAIRR